MKQVTTSFTCGWEVSKSNTFGVEILKTDPLQREEGGK
jgi:hypothetical protein